MKIKDFLKVAAGRVLREVPGVDVVLDVVEAVTGEKLDKNQATGDDLGAFIEDQPPEVRAKLLEYKVAVIQEQGETMRAMLLAEQNSTHTTRPKIASRAFNLVAYVMIVVVSVWAVAVLRSDDNMVGTIMDGWPFLLSFLAPVVGWLNSYFGVLKSEHQNRLDAARGMGTKRTGVAGIIDAVKGR